MTTMLSTMPNRPSRRASRRMVLLGGASVLSGCVSEATPPGPRVAAPDLLPAAFVLSDGARLPYRAWLPEGPPTAVILALHGFNDSRDAWDIPAPVFAAAGIAVYAPDQRGFGAAPGRGLWPGGDALADDAAEMLGLLRGLHPGCRLLVMGESMGGAVAMRLATRARAPAVDGYILIAPAVWGRARMNIVMRSALWIAATMVPGMEVSRPPPGVTVRASDNIDALIALARNPLTIRGTRFDTVRGLVDLMDMALAAAPLFNAPALFQYGAKDELVPKPATLATWRVLPGACEHPDPQRLAYYPNGWHLLMRDLDRALPIHDAIGWIRTPGLPLPSGADARAQAWLTAQA